MRNLILLLLLPASAAAAQQAPAPAKEAVRKPPIVVTGKRVCVNRLETGSIIPHKVCRTAEEWAAQDERSLARFQEMKDWQQRQRMIAFERQEK